jgi:hypothetical protein
LKIFKSWFKKEPIKEKHMQHFSQEYVETLIAEHRMVSAAVALIKNEYPKRTREHGALAVDAALGKMYARKVELEGYIDVLQEYLNG